MEHVFLQTCASVMRATTLKIIFLVIVNRSAIRFAQMENVSVLMNANATMGIILQMNL